MRTRIIEIVEIVSDRETEHHFVVIRDICRYEIFKALRNVARTRIDTAGTGNYKFGRQLIPTTMRRQRAARPRDSPPAHTSAQHPPAPDM